MHIDDIPKKSVRLEKIKFHWALRGRKYLGHFKEGVLKNTHFIPEWVFVKIEDGRPIINRTLFAVPIRAGAKGEIFLCGRYENIYVIREKGEWITLEALVC